MTELTRAGDHWVLPVVGQSVFQLRLDYAVTLCLGNDVEVRIEEPFVLAAEGGQEWLVVPEGDAVQLAPVLGLNRSTVAWGAAFDDGRLELSFVDGWRVSVTTSEDYEAWTVAGPHGLLIVSMPGGDLAVWHPDEP
ncbi:hypothetical protein LY13_005100 [Prauserella aidingensis]|uniref:DUF6188 family protein n=1 Tax=Prauserella aidingensis TaxID=387890 RepID=UPI0020A51D5D|nr:DUF6188 family protein [Prauserella aidingensis]MCP2256309.1 hypothetical protein [Prauserella aidingensis]